MSHSGTALLDPYSVFREAGLSEGMRIADLGCGRTGQFVFPASKIVGDQGIVYAVDIIKDVLESIRSRARTEGHHNVETVWANIESEGKTAIPAAGLDICFVTNILSYLSDKPAALREALRLTRPGGLVVVVDWARKLGVLGPAPEAMTSPEQVGQLVPRAVAETVKVFEPGRYHYAIIFKKVGEKQTIL